MNRFHAKPKPFHAKPWALAIMLGVATTTLAQAGATQQPAAPTHGEKSLAAEGQTELFTEAQIARWLADDPAIQRLQAHKQALQAEAAQVARSGYEWTASYSRQEREYRQPELAGAGKSREWSLELERSLRLPGKGEASHRQAEALRQLANADEQAGLRLATSELIDHYLDALHASARLALLGEEQALAQANLHAVEHRVKAGDAPALDARLAAAERQALAQELAATGQMAINHWTSFRLRYPAATLPRFVSNLGNTLPQVGFTTTNTAPATVTLADSPALRAIPEPRPLHGDLAHWQARLLNQPPALQQASAQLNAASAAADKARRERIPDPSLAFYSGRESFGEEAVVGLRLSMPLPGNHRSHAMRQRYAEEAIARADKEILQRSLRAEAENRYRQAHNDFQRWQLAKQMAGNLGENARLLHKAYRLGEQDLQGLLLGQQQHARAALAEVESRVQALRSYYQLQVAAGELNPFSSATNTNVNTINTSESLTGNLQ